MNVKFHKYQGTGNDFIILNNRYNTYSSLSKEQIEKLCDRHFGIGADGLMLLENMIGHDFKMVYYNSDGRQSSMCGNGGRCIVRFAADQKMIANTSHFIAIDGPHDATILDNGQISLKMIDVPSIERLSDDFLLNTGSPHYVVFVENVAAISLVDEARKIRYNARFKEEGINVNFVQRMEDGTIKMRTYERGVEDETLSCGTGVVAAAIAYSLAQNKSYPIVKVQTLGGELSVDLTKQGEGFGDIWLTGAAQKVFEGSIEI